MILTLSGRVPDSTTQAFQPGKIRDRLSEFGSDIVGLWIPQSGISIDDVDIGSAVTGAFSPAISAKDTKGHFRTGTTGGATWAEVDGLKCLQCSTGIANVLMKPSDISDFGIGLIAHLDAAAIAASVSIFGNSESGGGYTKHELTRSVGGSVDGYPAFLGVTTTWLRDSADVYTQNACRITSPGWYIFTLDNSGGNSAMRINDGLTAIAPGPSTNPTMTSSYIGNTSAALNTVGTISCAAAFCCNGPLAQDEARAAQWLAFAQSVMADLKA